MTARRSSGPEAGGWLVLPVGSVGSTMDEARTLAAGGAADRTVVRATEQTGGRGRLGRSWASPAGNVYGTAILRPPVPPVRASELSLLAAVAVADAVERFAAPVTLKWPNDVLLDGGKVAGVLLEAITEGASLNAVLVGIGINVVSRPELEGRRTARIDGADADAVFAALLAAMAERLDQWAGNGLDGIRSAWLARGPRLGSALTVGQGNDVLRGAFAGLDDAGALRLELEDGSLRRVASGEVLA